MSQHHPNPIGLAKSQPGELCHVLHPEDAGLRPAACRILLERMGFTLTSQSRTCVPGPPSSPQASVGDCDELSGSN